MIRVELYARTGSVPCDEARALLERLHRELPFELAEVDVASDPALERAFGGRVPVVRVDGRRLRRAFSEGDAPGQAHLIMGILEGRQGNRPASKKHFAEAERIARQTKDADLAKRVDIARFISSDSGGLLRHLMDIGGDGLLEEFLIDLDQESDDD